MKAEAWIFGICTDLLRCSSRRRTGSSAGDPTGTSALTMTTLLAAAGDALPRLPRPRWTRGPRTARTPRSPTAPASWASSRRTPGGRCGARWRWPCRVRRRLGAWWLVIIGAVLGAVALSGWVFEYYRGEHAH